MKGTFTQLGLVLLAVLFFSSCKREESLTADQNRIYSEYHYTYDAKTNKTIAQAEFRINNASGKKLELSYPATVRFNGEALSWRRLNGDYQLTSYATPSGGMFKYQDTEDQTYQNEAKLLNSVEFPFGISSISKNADFFLPWIGDALESGETIEVTIRAGASRTFRVNTVGSTYLRLDRNALSALTAGQAQIEIERIHIGTLAESTFSGGRMTTKYKGRSITVTLTE
ncbi:MAG: hypothetical protein JKY54_16890 [Flavobacteriales bacterium]|nr:hypothetical protein [Flavobacteriales bacterium]